MAQGHFVTRMDCMACHNVFIDIILHISFVLDPAEASAHILSGFQYLACQARDVQYRLQAPIVCELVFP